MTLQPVARALACCALLVSTDSFAQNSSTTGTSDVDTSQGDALVTEYFRNETQKLTDATFADIKTLEDWTSRRDEYRRQLFEMLGLDPLPKRTELKAVVTGTIQHENIVVERLHFQSRPGLYVTGNLYRPKQQDAPLPAILYVCGHGREKEDGVSYGNKTHYQHHGSWFARNGYVCLMIDTIQLGEIEGIHHGTYREKMWWWNNRGYTPAGVEAWNCIRSLDYLQSRDEVDNDRIGVTGRSGGGAYSWWVAALDDRIKVAVPVAGITSLHNHVVDGVVEGHCDCMYMVNTYRWDYPMVAALVAPRPLLISNTDKDRIFPLDGVVDVYAKVRKIYSLYEANNHLGLNITEGPHKDTQELRVHAFRWFNRFLKDDDTLIETVATNFFQTKQLRVFDELPADEIVTQVHETFVPAAPLPTSATDAKSSSESWMTALRERVFRGWPVENAMEDLDVRKTSSTVKDDVMISTYEFTSQSPYRLSMEVREPASEKLDGEIQVVLLNQERWNDLHPAQADNSAVGDSTEKNSIEKFVSAAPDKTLVLFAPRGIGPTEWSRDPRARTHIRRRFMQLGQTAASMQIWDARRMLQALDATDRFANRKRIVNGFDDGAVWALYASLFEPRVSTLQLEKLAAHHRQAPDLLNVSRFVDVPHLLLMAADRAEQIDVRIPITEWKAWKETVSSGIFPANFSITRTD